MNYRIKMLLLVILITALLLPGCQISGFWSKPQPIKLQTDAVQNLTTSSKEGPSVQINTVQEPVKQVSTPQANSDFVVKGEANSTVKNELKNTDPLKLLDGIEYNSGNILFDIIKLDWDAAQKKVVVIKDNLSELTPIINASNVSKNLIEDSDKTVDNLDKSIAANRIYESKEESNKLIPVVADIEDAYNTKFPTDIYRLGYLSREIHININKNDWKTASTNYKEAENTWSTLKLKFGDKYKDEVGQAESTIASLGNSVEEKNSGHAITASNQLLWDLTSLKNNFR